MERPEVPRSGWGQRTDSELLAASREGSSLAFAELWNRHHRAGLAAAHGMAPHLDAQDLVAESFLKILALIADGRGPSGAFRPYMYRVIRSLSSDWSARQESPSDELDSVPDLNVVGPWEDQVFDRNAAAEAFASLEERWRAVLWYTEVEGMPPREVSRIMGISANSVSALAARARTALRSAWVEAHVNRELAAAECAETIRGLQRYQRGKLPAAASRAVAAHLDGCESCRRAAGELSTLNRQLALVIAGLVVGVGSAGSLLSGLGTAAPAAAAAFSPALSSAAASAGGSTASTAGTAGSASTAAGSAAAATGRLTAVPTFMAVAAATVLAVVVGASAVVLPELFDPDTSRTTPAEADQGTPEATHSAQDSGGDEDESPTDDSGDLEDPGSSEGLDDSDAPGDLPVSVGEAPRGETLSKETQEQGGGVNARSATTPAPKPGAQPNPNPKPDPAPEPEPDPEPDPAPEPEPEPSDDYVAEYSCATLNGNVVWVRLMNPPPGFQRLRVHAASGASLSQIDILGANDAVIHTFAVDPLLCDPS